ncbi:hypothetical protein AGABI2DRAFT_188742 [Agaricus bisporus var. bisporus H97]|uniref:hypothetical protein n=1 Tax=Agaricus bisporus var. bisporus (strain H97 / ATCC MYA-4626 / FGSC 10389) TaxID=936046 RepID=UPI00029F7D1A|nr:hypothetical protein AGABI2DRAFT_188742 [Agaricus bisporus var. bisporus H97]EKV42123.1 hypothetical protein AGABI2DRAFT_188742 [Agaricus bisporus var. bisporus H97]
MTADTPMTSFDNAPSVLAEWNSLSEEAQIKEQEDLTEYLKNPDTLTKFIEACRDIRRTVDVDIEGGFRVVFHNLLGFVGRYGEDFPAVERRYVHGWVRLIDSWKETVRSSMNFASETVAALTDYGINLELIADINSAADLMRSQRELKAYMEKRPIAISTRVADGFKEFVNDVRRFSTDFTHYLEQQRQQLTTDAKQFEADIRKFQNKIADCIKDASTALSVTIFVFLVAAIPAGYLIKYKRQREEALANLKEAQAGLAKTVGKQVALAAIQADVEKFKPDIDDLCGNFGVLASIWAFATEQSIEINIALQEGTHVITTKKFKAKLALLMAQIEPLKEGLREYAGGIA